MTRAGSCSMLLGVVLWAGASAPAAAETCDVDSGQPEAVMTACNKKLDSWFLDNDTKANAYFNRGQAHLERRDVDAAIADLT